MPNVAPLGDGSPLILDLNQHYTTPPPIHRLADDTLIQIFSYHTPQNNVAIAKGSDNWLNIIHVCRRWRAVAIAFPDWWTSIIAVDPDLTSFMLKNSQSMPIDLDVDVSAYRGEASYARRLVRANLPRLRTLRIGGTYSGRNVKRVLEVLAQYTAPVLHEVQVYNASRGHADDDLSLPEDVFPPTLRIPFLYLKHCRIAFDPGSNVFLSNLTSLKMKGPVGEIHHVLRRTKVLTFAHLKSTETIEDFEISLNISPWSTTHHVIGLPHLRHLHFEGPVAAYTVLARHLSLPLDAIVTLDLKFEHDNAFCPDERKLEVELPILLDHLEDRLKCRQDKLNLPFRKLHLEIETDLFYQGVAIHAFSAPPDGLLPHAQSRQQQSLSRNGIGPDRSVANRGGL